MYKKIINVGKDEKFMCPRCYNFDTKKNKCPDCECEWEVLDKSPIDL